MATFPALLCNRVTKLIIGPFVKGLGYVFHAIFPNKRFTLPAQAKPLLRSKSHKTIPRILWQTNFTNQATLPVYLNYLWNRLMAPRFAYRFMVTQDRDEYLQQAHPDVYQAYQRLTVGAAQADLWRLAVLYDQGGVYLDMDGCLMTRLEKRLKEDQQQLFITNRKKRFTNYFIAAAPGNLAIKQVLDQALDNIAHHRVESGVYHLTGPGVLNQVLTTNELKHRNYRYTCIQGVLTNQHFQYIDKDDGKKWTQIPKDQIIR